MAKVASATRAIITTAQPNVKYVDIFIKDASEQLIQPDAFDSFSFIVVSETSGKVLYAQRELIPAVGGHSEV